MCWQLSPVIERTMITERNQNERVFTLFRNWTSLGVVLKEAALSFER